MITRKKTPKNRIYVPPGFMKGESKDKTVKVVLVCIKCKSINRFYGSARPGKGLKCRICELKRQRKKNNAKTKNR